MNKVNDYEISVLPVPEYEAPFRLGAGGWWGGDVGFSMALDADRVLWLFGDTFIQRNPNMKGREGATVIHNSIAVQRGRFAGSGALLHFYWQKGKGKQRSFFTQDSEESFIWPVSSVLWNGPLYCFALRVVQPDLTDTSGFRIIRNELICIENPGADPHMWCMKNYELPWDVHELCFGSTVLVDAHWLYIYGFSKDGHISDEGRGLIIARLRNSKQSRIEDLESWSFYTGQDGVWTSDINRIGPVFHRANTEFSVVYMSQLNRYVMTGYLWTPRNAITIRFSDTPYGPFDDPRIVYDCPESDWSPNYICYTARAHPELSPSEAELIVSYVANSRIFFDTVQDLRIYYPRFLKMKIGR